jgi:hypothetical protein
VYIDITGKVVKVVVILSEGSFKNIAEDDLKVWFAVKLAMHKVP